MKEDLEGKILSFYDRYRAFGKELAINSIYRGLGIGLNLVAGIIMTRDLMEANRGQYQLFLTSLLFFYLFLNFGLGSSATYYAQKVPEKMKEYMGLNLYVSIVSSVVIAIVLLFFSDKINFQSIELRNLFFICYLFFSFHMIFKSFLVGKNENTYLQKISFWFRFFFFLWILFLHFTGNTSVFLVCLYLTFEYFLFSIISARKLKIKLFQIKVDKGFLKESLFFNIKAYLMAILWICVMRADQYFIKVFRGNFDVGLYSIGATVVENLGLVNAMFVGMALPRLIGESDYMKNLSKTKKGLAFTFILSCVLAIIIYYLSPYIVDLFFKKKHPVAIESMQILMIGFVFWSLYQVLSVVYLSQRIKKTQLGILGFCTALSFLLNYLYVVEYGIVASAWISTLCYFIMFAGAFIDLFYLKRKNWLKKNKDE